MRSVRAGRAIFAATLVVIGLWGLLVGGPVGVWDPVPRGWPAREIVGHLCALVALAAGAGLLWRRTERAAAGLLLASLLFWMLAVKGPPILAAPLSAVSWESCGETAVLVAAAWTLFADLGGGGRGGVRWLAGDTGARIGRVIYGLAMLAFGWSHFAYAAPTAHLVPRVLPAHLPWVYATGSAYVAAGAAILSGRWARLAAVLSAVQMGLFTLLVWVPVVVAGAASAEDRSELILSWTLTTAGWVVADGYLRAARRRS